MLKYIILITGTVFLTTSAFAGVHGRASSGRDSLPRDICSKRICKNDVTAPGHEHGHMHATVFKTTPFVDLEARRLSERGGQRSVRN